MNAVSMEERRRLAIESTFESPLAITGAAGTGKTTALLARIERFAREYPSAPYRYLRHPAELADIALECLTASGRSVELIDDVEARAAFEHLALPLLELEWEEIVSGRVDPEVPGLRSPERFLDSAFRLIRKLRDAAIDAAAFLDGSLAAATAFYANPPNFASPELILATKDTYRDSLDVDGPELQRQYRREVDLVKVLAQLYAAYERHLETAPRITARDAILAATALRGIRSSQTLFIDEAQEGTAAHRALLEALLGRGLRGLTLAGDPGSATGTFRGARPERMFEGIAAIELREQFRSQPGIEIACRQLAGSPEKTGAGGIEESVVLYRPKTQHDEARYIAEVVRAAIDAGTPPHAIALVFRSTCDVHGYEAALERRDVPVAVYGDVNPYADRRALDALALLWNLWDPFAHDWMLRTLGGRRLALSDLTLAKLCAEPPDNQTALFAFDAEPAPTTRSGRWDPKRDLRLGWNVTRGDVDASLGEEARARLEEFRRQRQAWVAEMPGLSLDALARRVWNDALAADGPPGSARALSQQFVLQRLLRRLVSAARANPQATLGDLLTGAQERSESELESAYDEIAPGLVPLLNIDAARGKSFEIAIVPDARAGSFPRWYVPDSFIWSPKLGMIPKDNAGDARAARTAKFSYYMHRAKVRDAYNAEERRAFIYALRRARARVYVTAYDRATRGLTAPEFYEELRAAKLPGTRIE